MNNKEILDFLNKIKFRTSTLSYAIYDSDGQKTVAIILPSSYLDRHVTSKSPRSIEILECISVTWRNAAIHNYKALKAYHTANCTNEIKQRIDYVSKIIAKEMNALKPAVVRFFAGTHTCCPGIMYLTECIGRNICKDIKFVIVSSATRLNASIPNDSIGNVFTYSEGSNSRNCPELIYDDTALEYDLTFIPKKIDTRVKSYKSEIKSGSLFYKTVVEQSMRVLCDSCNYTPEWVIYN